MSKINTQEENKNQPRWFKSSYVHFDTANSKIDFENGIITDVVLCQAGEASGHGVHLENSFISDLVDQGQQFENGMKCRFGHPSMSSEALGTYVGRFNNVRLRNGNEAIADLHLDESAKLAPGGNLYDYVLELAKSSPDMFGCSIVFIPGDTYQYNEKGDKVIVKYNDSNPEMPLYVALKELIGTDLVDEGAATDGLFSGAQFNQHAYAVRVTEFLDSNPDIYQFIDKNPDILAKFIEKYNELSAKKGEKASKITFYEGENGAEIIEEAVETKVDDANNAPETDVNTNTDTETETKVEETEEEKAPEASLTALANKLTEAFTKQINDLKEEFAATYTPLKTFEEFAEGTSATHTKVDSNTDVIDAGVNNDPNAQFRDQPWNKTNLRTSK